MCLLFVLLQGPKPTEFAECEIQYIGYFTNGKVWANTYRGFEQSVKFPLKKSKVIYGWEVAVLTMRKGEKARFKISSAYAYGANGNPPLIPPETNLVFDIELVDWKSLKNRKDKFMEKTTQTYEELVAGAEKEKKVGNELFEAGDYVDAIERYNEALQYARFVYEPRLRHATRPLMLACELNKAFCYLKLKNWRECIKCCDEAIKMNAHESKAYYRKAVAFRMLGQDAEARKNILQAKRLNADDPGIDREMTLIEWQADQRKKKEKKVFGAIFNEEQETVAASAPSLEHLDGTAMAAATTAAAPRKGPVVFKGDERFKKVDHVLLPGEEELEDKWGGKPSATAEPVLPRGDFPIVREGDVEESILEDTKVEEEDAKDEAAVAVVADDGSDDEMPSLEPIQKKRAEKKAKQEEKDEMPPPPLEPISKTTSSARPVAAQKDSEPATRVAASAPPKPVSSFAASDEKPASSSSSTVKLPPSLKDARWPFQKSQPAPAPQQQKPRLAASSSSDLPPLEYDSDHAPLDQEEESFVAPPVPNASVPVASSLVHATSPSHLAGEEEDDEYVYDNSVTNESNPKVFLNFAIDGEPAGKIIVELFRDRVPKTAENFRALCTGEKGKKLCFKGTQIHRLIPNYILQGGDIAANNGKGEYLSIYGGAFADERLDIPVDSEGLLCMASEGPNTKTIASQFFFTLAACPHLTGKYVVVGKVIEGIEVLLDDLPAVGSDKNDKPLKTISIRGCGEFSEF